jgi:excisionase family DNA binding protein
MYLYEAIISRSDDDLYVASIPDLGLYDNEGLGEEETLEKAASMLKKNIQKYLLEGEPVPEATFGHKPEKDERVLTLALDVTLDKTKWFTVEEAMVILNVTQPRVSHLLRNGKLKAYREGRRTYVLKSSLQTYLVTPRHAGRPPAPKDTLLSE